MPTHPLNILAEAKTNEYLKALSPTQTRSPNRPRTVMPPRLRQTTLNFGAAPATSTSTGEKKTARSRQRQGRIEDFVGTPNKKQKRESQAEVTGSGKGSTARKRQEPKVWRSTTGSAEKKRSGLFSGGTRRQRQLVSDDDEEYEGMGSALVGYNKDELPEPTGNDSDRGEETEDGDSEDETMLASPAARRRKARVVDEEDDEDEESVTLPPLRREADGGEDEDEDEDIPVSSVRRRRSAAVKYHAPSSPVRSRPITLETSSSDHDEPPHPPSSVTRRRLRQKPVEDTTDDDLEIIPPKQDGDDNELDDDDFDIAAQTPKVQTRTRYAEGKKLTPYQLKLRALKKKRDKASASADIDDEEEEEGEAEEETPRKRRKALYDTDSQEDAEGGLDTPMEDIDSEEELNEWERFNKTGADSDQESWIVDDTQDNEGLLGAPDGTEGIPLEFTNVSHMTYKESFRVYCQYLTLSILLPDLFTEPDEIVRLALRRVENQLQGYAGSVLTSSVWTPRILRALNIRPELVSESCPAHEGCDACNRDRSSTHRIRLFGRRYDKETLRALDDSDTDSGEEEEEGGERGEEDGEDGEEKEGERRWFYLGSSCWRRAKLLHAFTHWRWSLRQMILGVLEGRGVVDGEGRVMAPEGRISEEEEGKKRGKREKRKGKGKGRGRDEEDDKERDKKREKWARGLMEDLSYEMDALYGDLKGALESARRDMEGQRAGRW